MRREGGGHGIHGPQAREETEDPRECKADIGTVKRFSGLEIKPFSQVTDLKRVRIDRVRVEVRKTLFGEIEYDIIGTMGPGGVAGMPAAGRYCGCMASKGKNRGRH